ncbi:MAG: hypothetical protein M0037_14140 [Betaproteobacteria bacterium]|nr:hypothetical protein [Betaproteobacteria bacterium]
MKRKLAGWALSALLGWGGVRVAHAAQWSMNPSVSATGQYDSNLLMTTAPHASIWSTVISPAASFTGQTQTLSVTGSAQLNANRFSEHNLNSNDRLFALDMATNTQRSQFGVNVNYTRDSTLESELATTGLVELRAQRSLSELNPTWSFHLTPRWLVTAAYDVSKADYSDAAGTNLVNYSDQNGILGLQYDLSPRGVASLSAYYDQYRTRPAQYKARTYGLQAGYRYHFSPTLEGDVAVGARRTHATLLANTELCAIVVAQGVATCIPIASLSSPQSADSTGYTFDGNVKRHWQSASLALSLSRAVTPSGLGALVQTDRLGLDWAHHLSATWAARVSVATYRTRFLDGTLDANNNRYSLVNPSMSWKLTREWTVSTGYSYARSKYDLASKASSDNRVYATLIYRWPQLSVSR